MYTYIYIYIYIHIHIPIHIPIHIYTNINNSNNNNDNNAMMKQARAPLSGERASVTGGIGRGQEIMLPVHLLRVFLLRVLESNFPGDSL